MKTLEELYKEVINDREIQKEFVTYAREKKILEFAEKHDCKISQEELVKFLKEKFEEKEGKVDADTALVSGGGCGNVIEEVFTVFNEIGRSIITAGVYCIVQAIDTLVDPDNPNRVYPDGRICRD